MERKRKWVWIRRWDVQMVEVAGVGGVQSSRAMMPMGVGCHSTAAVTAGTCLFGSLARFG